MKKVLIVIGIVVVVLVVAGAILLSNLDRVVAGRKDALLAQAQERVGREVTVEEIKVGVWPSIGVSLKNVTLADDPAFSSEPFVTVRDLRVNVRLMPLLRKQIEVKRLVLNDVAITLIVDENGVRNIDSMIPANDAQADAPGAAAEPSSAAAIPLVLAFADIKGGTVRYVDRATGLDHTIRDIDFTARDVSLDSEMSFELSAAVLSDETDTRISGTAGPIGEFTAIEELAGAPLSIDVTLGPVAVEAAIAMLPESPELVQLSALDVGNVDVRLSVRGTLGAISVEDIAVRAAVMGATEVNATFTAAVAAFNPLDGFDPAELSVRGALDVGPLSLAGIREAAGTAGVAPPELSMAGAASLSATFQGPPGAMTVKAELDVTEGAIIFGDAFKKPAGIPMLATVDARLAEKSVSITAIDLQLGDLRVKGQGTIVDGAADLTFTAEDTDVSALAAMLPALAEISPSGTAAFEARIRTTANSDAPPDINATLTIKNGGATLPQLPRPVTEATATVIVTGTTARVEGASLKVGQSLIRMTARADQLEPLVASYRISSERIWKDDFVAPTATAPRPEVLDNVVAAGRVWRDAPAPATVQHEGTISSSKGVVANLDYTAMNAKTRSEGEVIVIDSFSAKSLDGTVSGNGRVEPKSIPPRFDIHTEVKGIDLARYLQYKFPTLANVIEGRIDMNFNMAGAGATWEEIVTTLEGDGGALVVRGSLLNVNLANELLAGIEGLPLVGSGVGDRIRRRNPKLFSGKSTAFENLDGVFTIANGRINTNDLFLKAADFMVKGDGWLSFDRQMSLRTSFVFSEKLTADIVRELPIAKYLKDSRGRIVLPLVFSGDVVKPRIAPDSDAISAALQRGVVDEGRNNLKGQVEKGVRDLFKGFGKKKRPPAPPDTTGGGF